MVRRIEKVFCKRCPRELRAQQSRQSGYCTNCESIVKSHKKEEDLKLKAIEQTKIKQKSAEMQRILYGKVVDP